MDPIRNPYSPGAGSRPPALVGRDAQLDAFDTTVQRLALGRPAKSLILTGLRGVGKTVLLHEFGRIAARHRWVHQPLEATEDLDLPASLAMVVRKAAMRLSMGERMAERRRRILGVLKRFQMRWNFPDSTGGSTTLSIEPLAGIADSGILDEDLADLFIEVATLAQVQGLGVVLTIDEIQYLPRDDLAALIVSLHRISQEALPLLVVGAGLPSVPALAGEAKSYAERLFTFIRIKNLDREDAAAALSEPATSEGVTWDQDALDLIVATTRGYPYFLQEFGNQVWDVAGGPEVITVADALQAIPLALGELDTGFFTVRIDRTSDTERLYLSAMASLGEGPYSSGDVAAAMGRTTTQVGPLRDSLIKRGLCYSPRYGLIDFTVPMFDQFIRRAL